MAQHKNKFRIWNEMSPASTRRLALAVFLMFSVLGPIQFLMESHLAPFEWSFIIFHTFALGGVASTIILLNRRKLLLLPALLIWIGIFIAFDRGFSIGDMGEGLQSHFQEKMVYNPFRDTLANVTLSRSDLQNLYTQHTTLGIMAILFLTAGYAMFIYVIRTEVRKRARLETEMRIAQDIQTSLLPEPLFDSPCCAVAGLMMPAAEVGGDYYDVIECAGGGIAVAIADVTGHGVGAGILSAMTKSALRLQVGHDPAPARTLGSLNATLYDLSNDRTFITCAYVLFDPQRKTVSLSTAGHLPILHRPAGSQAVVQRRTASLALAMKPDAAYSAIELPARSGDLFFLYTDGAVEAMDNKGEQYGMDRLAVFISRAAGEPHEICAAFMEELRTFTRAEAFNDDVTIVCLRMK